MVSSSKTNINDTIYSREWAAKTLSTFTKVYPRGWAVFQRFYKRSHETAISFLRMDQDRWEFFKKVVKFFDFNENYNIYLKRRGFNPPNPDSWYKERIASILLSKKWPDYLTGYEGWSKINKILLDGKRLPWLYS